MRAGPRVVTVVVNYRHYDDTVRCISALQASDYLNQRVIVVENTEMGDRTADLGDMLDPGIEVVDAGGNLGFAGGCNVGTRSALAQGAEFVWLVNPDAVVAPDTLSAMLAAAADSPEAGVLGSRILDGNSPPRILFNGGTIDAARKGSPSHQDAGRLDRDVLDAGVRDVDYVTGSCFLVRRNVLQRVGLLPEEYFLYFEETDYCVRVRQAGWRVVIVPKARVWHFQRSTSQLPEPYYIYYMCRNRALFSQRFFAADVSECEADMAQFLAGWRGRVQAHAPYLVAGFDALVGTAFEDARAGLTGRRADIDDIFAKGSLAKVPVQISRGDQREHSAVPL
jgi:GT2 family glycosyltransferase